MSRGSEGSMPRFRSYGVDLSNSAFFPFPLGDSGTTLRVSLPDLVNDENVIKQIDITHEEIHEGKMHHFSNLFILTATSYYIMISTLSSTLEAHFGTELSTSLPLTIRSFYNATVSANGTEINPFNRKIGDSTNIGTRVFFQPTIVATGTLFSINRAGTGAKINAIGGTPRDSLEWVLPAGRKMLIQFDSDISSNTCSFEVDIHEH